MSDAYRLACEIEVIHAKDKAALMRQMRRRTTWKTLYDAHAATELGALIEQRMRCRGDNP